MAHLVKAIAGAAAALLAALPAGSGAAENGIKIGDGRLHPYLALEGRYDSNVLYGVGGAPVADLVLHLKPGFDLQIPGNQLSVDFGANLDWNKYLGLKSDATKDLSHLFGEATLALAANRVGTVGLELDDSFRRSDQSRSYSIAMAVVANYNDLRLAVPFRPGGGALAVTVGGQWLLETFESFASWPGTGCDPAVNASCDPQNLSRLGYNQVSGRGEVRWKFLPRTAVTLEASYFVRIPKDTAISAEVKGLKTLAGLAGLVTPHLAATVKGGYGDTFGSAGAAYRTWLANVEIEYVTVGGPGGRVGYVHEYSADPVYAVYGVHRIYLEGRMLLGGRLTAAARGEYDSVQYEPSGSLQIATFSPKLEVEVTRWLYASAGYGLTWRSASGGAAALVPGYTKHEVWLSAKLVY
jgi:hypothetical protein